MKILFLLSVVLLVFVFVLNAGVMAFILPVEVIQWEGFIILMSGLFFSAAVAFAVVRHMRNG